MSEPLPAIYFHQPITRNYAALIPGVVPSMPAVWSPIEGDMAKTHTEIKERPKPSVSHYLERVLHAAVELGWMVHHCKRWPMLPTKQNKQALPNNAKVYVMVLDESNTKAQRATVQVVHKNWIEIRAGVLREEVYALRITFLPDGVALFPLANEQKWNSEYGVRVFIDELTYLASFYRITSVQNANAILGYVAGQ